MIRRQFDSSKKNTLCRAFKKRSTELSIWGFFFLSGRIYSFKQFELFLGHFWAILVKYNRPILQGVKPLDLFRG